MPQSAPLGAVILLFVLADAPGASAQTPGTATGNIDGTLTDRTGAVLPGVTVVVAGDALMGHVTTTSGPDGMYRVSGVPPGAYALEFSRKGFRSRRQEHVGVAIGRTATVNITLAELAFEVSIVVAGAVPTVDRHATPLAASFTAAELAHLPGARTPDAILWATPSVSFQRVDVGGSTPVSQFSAYGMSGMVAPTIEGMNITGMNQFGFAPDYGAFAEVSVNTGGYGPEWPTPGVHFNALTKSGGNAYHGTVVAAYEHRDWQSHNIDASQIALGATGSEAVPAREVNRLEHYHDVNADAGGFIRRDRVWWYTSGRHQSRSARQVLFPAEPIATTIISTTVKSTVRLADRHRLIGYAQGGQNREPIRLAGFLFPNTTKNESRESTSSQLAKGLVWKAEWNAVVRNDLFAEIRVGQFVASRAERPNGSSPRVEDSSTLTVSGGHRDWQEDRRNDQVNGALSVVTERLGRHHLKLGGEILRIVDGERWKLGFSGDVVHETQNDVPSQVYLFQTPSHARSGVWLYEAYASDSWQLKRLTLNLGLRFDRYHTFLPEQESYPAVDKLFAWTFVAPRLGASFDLGGNGRTVAKFTYARYWLPPLTAVGFNVNPNQPDRWERWTWSDDNHTGVWERGEEKVLQESHGGTAPISVDPQLRLPYVREVTARVEREVVTGFHVSTGVVWRGERQQGARHSASRRYEDFTVMKSLRDPGPDKEVGTGDDGPDIQVYELRPELLGLSGTIVRNLPHADNDYFSWELTGQRRLHGRWSLLAWFSTTWSRDHASGYLGQNVRANAFPLTPNDFINTDEQGHHRFCMWSARFWATYDGPWGIRVAPFLRHQSGQPFGRTLSTTLNYGTIHVLTEPIGTRRQDHITLFDLQVEKDFLIRSSTRLTAYVDVFNMLNANPEQQISWLTGRSFLRPLSIVPPRIARVGIRLGW